MKSRTIHNILPIRIPALLLLLFIATAACKKETTKEPEVLLPVSSWKAGDIFFDENQFTECVVGDMPLIISVPHGGQLQPTDIPDRSCDNPTTVTDLYTIELAREISQAFQRKFNVKPYLIMCHVKRTKIDQNRELVEGTCGNEQMKEAWNLFHNYIDTALGNAVAAHGSAIYIDLHGHGHTKQRLEIGYSLSGSELRDVYLNNGLNELVRKSSLMNLPGVKSGQALREYILGDNAFGTRIQGAGYPAIPSRLDPYPKEGEAYFNGGYNTRRYTSDRYASVAGWQIEANMTGVRDAAGRPGFADAFSDVMMEYMKTAIRYTP